MATVAEFIEYLKTQPQDIQVAFYLYSEQCLLDLSEISVQTFSEPRPDGWIEFERPDKPKQTYLMLPGN